MLLSHDLRSAVNTAMTVRLPFVLYIAPYAEQACFFADDGSTPLRSQRQFTVSNWCGGFSDEFSIDDRLDVSQIVDAKFFMPSTTDVPQPWSTTTDRPLYKDKLDEVLDYLGNHGGKVVISRTITGTGHDIDWLSVAEKYFELHPEAFRYLYFTPRHGFWLGASPELLLKATTDRFETMALAGTRPLTDDGKAWSGKNIAEQAIVRNYIIDCLYDLGLKPECGATETITTGNIQHLCTIISGDLDGSEPFELIRTLNPTPALAGYPLAGALEQIVEAELHPRRCYGGFIALQCDHVFNAYVNLRCVNFNADRWCLYVGSGIMPDSDPDEEWLETEAKSIILRTLIEDSQRQ